jgi:hypothetical protein
LFRQNDLFFFPNPKRAALLKFVVIQQSLTRKRHLHILIPRSNMPFLVDLIQHLKLKLKDNNITHESPFSKGSLILDWARKADLSHKPIKKAQLYRTESRFRAVVTLPAGTRGATTSACRTSQPCNAAAGRDAATRRDKQPPPLAGARWRCSRHRSFPFPRRLANASRLHRSWRQGQLPVISFVSSPTVTAATMHSAPLSPVSGRSTGGAAGVQLLPSTRRSLVPLKLQSRLPTSRRRRARRTWRASAKSKGSAASSLRVFCATASSAYWLCLRLALLLGTGTAEEEQGHDFWRGKQAALLLDFCAHLH